MEISFLGQNCVRLSAKQLSVLCDPYQAKQSADAILLTVQPDAAVQGGMVIDRPGEYEIKGATITGVPAQLHTDKPEDGQKATIYSVLVEGIRVGYLGNVAGELSDQQVEGLGQVDVLVLPVGGHGLSPDATSAARIISQLEPKYVVPTHYDDGKTKYEVPQDKLEVFLKEVGATPEPQPKLRVTTKDLPLETTVVVLQPSN